MAIALDIAEGSAALNEALRVTAERILATLPSARLACLNVLKLGRVTIDRTLDEAGQQQARRPAGRAAALGVAAEAR